MRTLLCSFVLFCCVSVFSKENIVASPQGGEVYVVGQTQTFLYSGRVFKTLTVELSRDGGVTWEAIGSIENKDRAKRNQFKWIVSGSSTQNARVRMKSTKGKTTMEVLSNSFIITDEAGLKGAKGEAGVDGKPGADGKNASAQDVADVLLCDSGFLWKIINALKCDNDFTAACKGDKGVPGLKGEKGDKGAAGVVGPPGKDCTCINWWKYCDKCRKHHHKDDHHDCD